MYAWLAPTLPWPVVRVVAIAVVAVVAAIVTVASPPSEPATAFARVQPATIACWLAQSFDDGLKSRCTQPI
jgi:hypothetical protein